MTNKTEVNVVKNTTVKKERKETKVLMGKVINDYCGAEYPRLKS